jgi:hypothetical protein
LALQEGTKGSQIWFNKGSKQSKQVTHSEQSQGNPLIDKGKMVKS